MINHRKPYKRLNVWPSFKIMGDKIDGYIPVSRVHDWKHFVEIVSGLNAPEGTDDLLFRGQRRYDWGLTPSLARTNKSESIDSEVAIRHLTNFKYSVRGRIKSIGSYDDVDVWAVGQHFGLKTPLLDWSRSPFVALFFALEQEDPTHERPPNYSRSVFVLNKTRLEEDGVDDIFVDTLTSEHDRLISQSGLFTESPTSATHTLESLILERLSENDIDIDDPEVLSQYLYKVHIPIKSNKDRRQCFSLLRKMNLHHASLYPDLIGSSFYCNELLNEEGL